MSFCTEGFVVHYCLFYFIITQAKLKQNARRQQYLFFFLTPCKLIPESLVLNFPQKKGEVNCAEALLDQLL